MSRSPTKPAKPTKNQAALAKMKQLRVAIVCDWLTGTGGAERVVLELHKMFPAAPIYTSQYDRSPKTWYGDTWFQDADIRTGWLQRFPKRLKKFLPVLRAWSFSRLDLSEYDLVISSSGSEAKAVKTGKNTTHIWYCHAPTHYYWSRYEAYMKHPGFGLLNPLARLGLRALVGPMRRWDYAAAQWPDHIIANSTHTQRDIEKYYDRKAVVVYPPVDSKRFKPASFRSDRFGFVVAGRQTPYKRIDLAVAACTELNLPLKVIGNGPDHNRLIALSGQSVRFLTQVSDSEMTHHFQTSEGFIFPGIDDFGIVAVEAMAAGTPVVAYEGGGATDYVAPGKTGEFFHDQTVESLMETLKQFQPEVYDHALVSKRADKYSVKRFHDQMIKHITKYLRI